jgi:hypothetical protein
MKHSSALIVVMGALLAGCHADRAAVGAPPPPALTADPPGRVAALIYMEGPVSFKPAESDEWVAAELNRPLITGDELWTDRDARAELGLGVAAIRMSARTAASILNLDDHVVQIKIGEGDLQVRLRRLDENDSFEIDTPNGAVSLLRTGDYRIQVTADGQESRVIVRGGSAEVSTPTQAFQVRAGEEARLTGVETVTYGIAAAPPLDDFDMFCQTREQRAERAQAVQYVSPYVVGWGELDAFGYWRTYPDYGWVWIPRTVPVGWAPYRFGHWVWISPWGWTWIDDSPWGFAPHHYGRWVFLDVGWCWIPGPVAIRAVYAPALVVFVGGGGYRYHFSVGVGLGVAWFPLGPREVYIPPYRASRVYVTNINVSHTIIARNTNIYGINVERQRYANRTVRGAITAVPEDTFVGGRRISRAALAQVTPEQAAAARIGGSAPPVAPSRQSLTGIPDTARPAPRPPDGVSRRPAVVRREPPAPPVPFEARRPGLERDPGHPLDQGSLDNLRRQQPTARPEYRQVPAVPQAPSATPAQRAPETRTPPPVAQPRPQAGQQQPRPAPQARPEARPQAQPQPRPQPAPQPSQRQVDQRRRTIEQEHQRAPRPAPAQRSRSDRSGKR